MKKLILFLGMFSLAISLTACNCGDKQTENSCSAEQCDTVSAEEENSHNG